MNNDRMTKLRNTDQRLGRVEQKDDYESTTSPPSGEAAAAVRYRSSSKRTSTLLTGPNSYIQFLLRTTGPFLLLSLLAIQPVLSQGTAGEDNDDDIVVGPTSNSTGIFDCTDCRVQDAVLFPWFVQLLGSCVIYLLTNYNIGLPYAAVMFVLGAFMGAFVSWAGNDNALATSIKLWANIDGQLTLLIFLPGLIFKDAVEFNLNMFLVGLPQILVLAFPMVLMGTALTAVVCVTILPYDWTWPAAATLGAILASTDPIAVSSVLKTAGASPRLVLHISGESLLNDGSAIVFFTLFSQLYYGEMGILPPGTDEITIASGFALFFRMSMGGTAIGLLFGFGLLGVLWQLDRRLEREFDVLQVTCGLATAYLCFYVCDQILTMSGIAACVTLGIVVNAHGRGMINDEKLMGNYLTLAEYCLNTLLFTLGGVIWASISFEDVQTYQIQAMDFGWLFVLYLLVMVIRFIQVGVLYPIFSRIGLKSNWREATFLAYGGLRGAVGVALGLQLIRTVMQNTENYEYRKLTTILQFMGGGVTLLTLSINGTSAGFILTQLGLAKPAGSADRAKILFEGMAKDFVYQELAQLKQERRFMDVNFRVLKEHVPFIVKDPSEELPIMNNQTGGASMRHHSSTNSGGNTRNGEQFIRVLQATNRAASFRVMSEEVQREIVVEIRQVFLELLGEAYHHQLDVGELDEKEDNRYLFDLLMHSVALATNSVEHDHSPIEDWQYTEIFRFTHLGQRHSPVSDDELPTMSSMTTSSSLDPNPERPSFLSAVATYLSAVFLNSLTHDGGGGGLDVTASAVRKMLTAKAIRYDVLRAISFKEGHEVAETKLQLYSNRLDDMDEMSVRDVIQDAVRQCLEESRKQTHLADEMLQKEITKQDLEIILSHYCARILIRRLMTFTERAVEDGVLGRIQGRLYLKEMDEQIRSIMVSAQKELEAARGDGTRNGAEEEQLGPVVEGGDDDDDDGSAIVPVKNDKDDEDDDGSVSLPVNYDDDDDSGECKA